VITGSRLSLRSAGATIYERNELARPKRFELLTPRFVVLFYSIP